MQGKFEQHQKVLERLGTYSQNMVDLKLKKPPLQLIDFLALSQPYYRPLHATDLGPVLQFQQVKCVAVQH